MIKAYTDLEQSKKLAKILPPESADMAYWKRSYQPNNYAIMAHHTKELQEGFEAKGIEYILCWSLAALMNLLPSEFIERGEYSETTYRIDIRKYALTDDVDIYQIAYGNYHWHEDGSCSWSDMINSGEKEKLIDAAFEMICWLKENGKI